MLEVEEATPDDHPGILALALEAFGAAEEPHVRLRLDGPQGDVARWTVVRDGGRVVSTCTLVPFALSLDGVAVPAGQVEFVATDAGYRRQGLVRRQIELHHRRSAEAGHIVQLIYGIPYVYRRFGYGYGISHPGLLHVERAALRPDPAVTVRPMAPADLDRLDDADLARGRAAGGLATDRRAALARRLWGVGLSDPPGSGAERQFVAERDGTIVGLCAVTLWAEDDRLVVLPSACTDRAVTDSLVTHAVEQAGSSEVILHDTTGAAWSEHLAAVGRPLGPWLGIYARVADPVAFLDVIRPVLGARLRASAFGDAEGSVTISRYDDAVALDYAGGEVTRIERVPGIEDPADEDECGVAPDWFPALVLGRWGARGLEERVDDVTLGRHADLLEVLFPRRPADIIEGF